MTERRAAGGVLQQLVLDLFGTARRADAEQKPAPAPIPSRFTAPEPVADEPAVPLAEALAPARFEHPRANRAIRLGEAHIGYELRRGQRRSIGFSVGADGLTVSAPRWSPAGEIEAALRAKTRWILAKLGEARERQAQLQAQRIEWKEGATVPFLGEPVVLRLDPRQRHGPAGAVLERHPEPPPGEPGLSLQLGLAHGATPAQLRDATQAWLMRQARRVFTERLDHFAAPLGVRWQRMGLSSAGTRWGSASADGSIRLNWRLIHFRQPIIDYVVVHELAHLREMNHSPRFWQLVETVLPDYAERRGALRDETAPW